MSEFTIHDVVTPASIDAPDAADFVRAIEIDVAVGSTVPRSYRARIVTRREAQRAVVIP